MQNSACTVEITNVTVVTFYVYPVVKINRHVAQKIQMCATKS